jgi:hypothetical protein
MKYSTECVIIKVQLKTSTHDYNKHLQYLSFRGPVSNSAGACKILSECFKFYKPQTNKYYNNEMSLCRDTYKEFLVELL